MKICGGLGGRTDGLGTLGKKMEVNRTHYKESRHKCDNGESETESPGKKAKKGDQDFLGEEILTQIEKRWGTA